MALESALKAYPVPTPTPRPDPVANPVAPATPAAPAAPSFDMKTAGQNFAKASAAQKAATDALGAAEGKAGSAKAAYQETQSDYVSGLHKREEQELRGLDQGEFKPTHDTLANMGALFTMVGMMGAFMGGKGTSGAAASAQAALTGIINGYNKGEEADIAHQKQIFDTNAQYLKDKALKVREIYKEYEEDALKVGIPTAQGRLQQRLLTEAEADVNAATVAQKGAAAGAKQAEDIFKMSAAFQEKKDRLDAEQHRQAEAFLNRMAMANMNAERGKMPDDAIQEMVQEYRAGNKQVLQGMGRGAAAAMNAARFRELLVANLSATGAKPEDIIKAQQRYAGDLAEQRTLGTQSGRLEGAIGALQETVPLALGASEQVDRTQFPRLNDIENAIRTGTGDTKIVIFNAYNQALVNDYAQIMRRGGVTTDEATKRGNDILRTGFAKGQYAAGVSALNNEATAVQNGLANAKDVVAGKPIPGSGDAAGRKKVGDIIYQGGQAFKVTKVDENGRVLEAN